MVRSVNYLVERFRRGRLEEVPDTWRGVKVSDVALGEDIQLPPAFLSEGVGDITQAAKEILQLPAITLINHAVHSFSTQNETGDSYMSVPNGNRANETTIFESCFVDQYNCL